ELCRAWLETPGAPGRLRRREGKNHPPAHQFYGVHIQAQSSKRGVIQMALCFVHEQMRTAELIRALQMEIFGEDAATQAQTDAAEIDVPSLGAQFLDETFFDKARQTNFVQEDPGYDQHQ